MKEIFLVDKNIVYTYDDLLRKLNDATIYYPIFKTDSLFDYFSNFILSLALNLPLTLIDSDLKSSEISGINENEIGVPLSITPVQFENIQELIARFRQSTSPITIFTSGTTGQPKKVVHNLSTLARFVRVSEKYSSQVWAFAYSPTHMAGIQVFLQAFENANMLVNVFNSSRDEVYRAIEKNGITHISATPTFYRLLLPVEKSYPTIIRTTFGGEKSDQKLYDSILKIFPNTKINNIYASTEAGSLFVAKGEYFQIPVSLKDKIKVINGELLIHRSLLGDSGHFIYVDDYYCSGDLIEWINENERIFRFSSRKNELINVGGYKVNPEEVENCILQLNGIQQARVFGKANSVLGNVLCAEIKLLTGSCLTEMDIRRFIQGKLQDFKIPRIIRFVESFSLTRTGKLKRI